MARQKNEHAAIAVAKASSSQAETLRTSQRYYDSGALRL
jgi:hypothetical protein